jgi:hypothetical protein
MAHNWRVLAAVAMAAAIAGWLVVTLTDSRNLDSGEIDRGLADLAEALRSDRTIEAEVLPPPIRRSSRPSTAQYRRAALFWQAPLTTAAKGKP